METYQEQSRLKERKKVEFDISTLSVWDVSIVYGAVCSREERGTRYSSSSLGWNKLFSNISKNGWGGWS